MNYDIFTLFVYLVAWLVLSIICGIGSACAGGGFLWGFFFGPVGIIVAAIKGEGDKTRRTIKASAVTAPTSPPLTTGEREIIAALKKAGPAFVAGLKRDLEFIK